MSPQLPSEPTSGNTGPVWPLCSLATALGEVVIKL